MQVVGKFKAAMESKISKFDSDMTAAASPEEFMAPTRVAKMKLWRRELGMTMDNVQLAIESGKFIGFQTFKASTADLKKALKTNTVLLMGRIKQATADKT